MVSLLGVSLHRSVGHRRGSMAWEIDTAAKRVRLAVRKNPYWRSVGGGRGAVSLGYRRLSARAFVVYEPLNVRRTRSAIAPRTN